MRAPSSAWRCISAHSSGVSDAGFSRIESGIASLPMSWKSAAWPSTSSSACESLISRPIASASCWTRREWPAVYESRASTVAESDSIAAVERSLSSRFACSSETFWVWIVSAASRSFCAERCVCAR